MKVALIGYGYWGHILEKYVNKNYDYQLKYICDSRSDLNEVWQDKEIEAVLIATRNEQRFPIIKDALLNHKHVLAEKPLALSLAEADYLSKLAEEKQCQLVVDYSFTVSKSLRLAQLFVVHGDIGCLKGFEMTANHLAPFGGGSVYWILGSHMLSILDMFIPLRYLSFTKHDIVKFDSVETGTILTDKGKINLSLNYPEKILEVVLYGSKGTIVYNPHKRDTLVVNNYERPIWVRGENITQNIQKYQYDEANNVKDILEYFNDVVEGKAKSNIRLGVKITEILENI